MLIDHTKTPLGYQISESDCGTVALLSGFSYLFERREIPPDLIEAVYKYTVDRETEGTSRAAMEILGHWLNLYAQSHSFPVRIKRLAGEEVTVEEIERIWKKNVVLVFRLWQTSEHYALVTKIDKEFVYIWDPYYPEAGEYRDDEQVEIIFDQPFSHNRRVSRKRFFSQTKKDFSLGEKRKREVMVISKIKSLPGAKTK